MLAYSLKHLLFTGYPEEVPVIHNLVLKTMSHKPKKSTRVLLPLPMLLLAKHERKALVGPMRL